MATRALRTMRDILTRRHIRTRCSLRTSTGPGRASWPRLQETERLQLALERLARRRAAQKEPRDLQV
jgi:hypothetical protein